MRGVGADEQDGAADLGQLDGQGARGRGLADASLAADEDPAEGALVEERLEGRLEGVFVDDCGHGLGRGEERRGEGKKKKNGEIFKNRKMDGKTPRRRRQKKREKSSRRRGWQ